MITGKPLFPGKNVVHQLDLMTDLLGTPPAESIARVSLSKSTLLFSDVNRQACDCCNDVNSKFLPFLFNFFPLALCF